MFMSTFKLSCEHVHGNLHGTDMDHFTQQKQLLWYLCGRFCVHSRTRIIASNFVGELVDSVMYTHSLLSQLSACDRPLLSYMLST